MQQILQPCGPCECNVFCSAPVAQAGLLIDAADYYRAFYRAALRAERFIVLSGWQFDTDVSLLRGHDAEGAELPVTLKSFLNALCERKPELQIYVLAWDFHMVFALEREWMQRVIFDFTTNERVHFRFDASHVENGAHHQKFAVIDGELSFLGGLDLCEHRWDDRAHREINELRTSGGAAHKPFHDVQAYLLSKEVAAELTGLFVARWQLSGGKSFAIPLEGPTRAIAPSEGVTIAASEVALSRTDPHGSPDHKQNCREIYELYARAISSAERSLFIETQYFSSHEICDVLVRRLRDAEKPALQIVMILNMEAETLKEEVAVGLAQAEVLAALRAAAEDTPHELGLYYTVPLAVDGTEPSRATYIHSKLLIVDDRFLTVGSANLTNRSLSVDTELNASFETLDPSDALGHSITRIRRDLLAEHLGTATVSEHEERVAELDATAFARSCRLRLHPAPSDTERALLRVVDPQQLPFDPDTVAAESSPSIFAQSLRALRRGESEPGK